MHFVSHSGWGIVAMLALAASSACRPPAVDPSQFPLVARVTGLLGETRPFDLRLTGSRRWTPCTSDADSVSVAPTAAPTDGPTAAPAARCSGALLSEALRSRAVRLAADVRQSLAVAPGTDALWAAALLDLATLPDNIAALDRAIGRLAEVAAREPSLAAPLSDLAVAQDLRAAAAPRPAVAFDAVESIERAADRDPTASVVAFNRAALRERAGLTAEAESGWLAFVRLDGTTDWSDAGRRRLAAIRESGRLNAAALDHAPETVRDRLLEQVLPAWGGAIDGGNDSLAAALAAEARSLAATSATLIGGDHWTADAVAALPRLDRAAARGLIAWGDGARLYREGQFVAAVGPLAEAVRALTATGEPALWGMPALRLAAVDIYGGRPGSAEQGIARVRRAAAARGYASLAAVADWALALVEARRGRLAESERVYRVAANGFARLGESAHRGAMLSQLAEIHMLFGMDDLAAAELAEGHRALVGRPVRTLRHNLFLSLGQYLESIRRPRAALVVYREGTAVSRETGRAKDLPEALARAARAAAALGLQADADSLAGAARQALAEVADPLMRDRIEVEILRAEAGRRDSSAVRRLTEAARYYSDRGIVIELADVMMARAASRLALGDSAAAERDLAEATSRVEERRRSAPAAAIPSLRLALAELGRLRVGYALQQGDSTRAFQWAERARWPDGGALPDPADAVRRLPPDAATVAYLVLDDRLLIWALTHDGVRLGVGRITRPALEELIGRYGDLLRRGTDPALTDQVGAALHAVTLQPVAAWTAGKTRLTIVPDGLLRQLPFAALRPDSAARYLIETASIEFTAGTGSPPAGNATPTTRDERVLVVGVPSFAAELFPGLDPLPGAAAEARDVAGRYRRAELVEGAAATRARILDALPGASAFHFAGHSRSVEGPAARSSLVLGGAPGGLAENVLFGDEIERLDLGSLRLVVLSACGSSVRGRSAGTAVSLERAFLAAGADAVVSSLWEIDDASTGLLMAAFHDAAAAGLTAAAALQAAQVEAIRREEAGGTDRRQWARFRVERR